jgi:hypothetical protein
MLLSATGSLTFSASDYSDARQATAGAGMLLAKIIITIGALNYSGGTKHEQ